MATNVALAANGGTASASSTFGAGFEASRANNGNRTGATWGTDGGWEDGTGSVFEDWLQIDFASATINEIDVFSVQDNYLAPSTPTLTMICSLYGLKDFELQYWTGSAWSTVPGGNVTGNNHVWVQITFTPVTTTKVRVLIHACQAVDYSRVVELEAWTAPSVPASPNTPSPANSATGVSVTPTLSWVAAGATSYDVYLGTAASPPLVNAGQSSPNYSPAPLSPSTTYFWKIVAINASGSTTGSVWSFTTMATTTRPSLRVTPIVEVELSGAGQGWTNISADLLLAPGIHIVHGIQGSSPADLVASTGTAEFALNNSARNSASLLGYYSLYHANKRAGWALGIGCRVRFQDPNTGTYYTRFVGRIDDIDPEPGLYGTRRVAVTATDFMDEAARWMLSPTIGEQVGKRGDEILSAIVAAMPRQPTATLFDVGSEAYEYALDTSASTGQPALSEFAKLAASEFGLIFQKMDGTLRFENRHARLLDTSSDWTLDGTVLKGLNLPSTRDEIFNTVRVTIHPKTVPLPIIQVYDQPSVIEIAPGTTRILSADYRDPVTGDPIGATVVQPQMSGTDYLANTSADGTGTNITADVVVVVTKGQSGAKFSVTNNNAATAYLTRNRLFGRGIYDRGAMTFEARDSVSVAKFGERIVEFDMSYQSSENVAQGAANYVLSKYSSAFAQTRSIRVLGITTALLAQLLARDISDRLTITEVVTGLNAGNYFVNAIDWQMLPSGHVDVTYVLASAPDTAPWWVLGTSVLGTNTIPAPF